MSNVNFLNSLFLRQPGCTGRVLLLFIAIGVCAGCGRKLAPVSFSEIKKDSSVLTGTTRFTSKDSSSLKVTYTEKILPGATIGITLTKKQMDSLMLALSNLPKGQSVTITDPKLLAQLKFMFDANNNLMATCTALDRQYNEKQTEMLRYIYKLEQENKSLKETHSDKTDMIEEEQLPWYKKLWNAILKSTGVIIILIMLAIGIVLWAWDKLRGFKLR
jgi:hypothetical protein